MLGKLVISFVCNREPCILTVINSLDGGPPAKRPLLQPAQPSSAFTDGDLFDAQGKDLCVLISLVRTFFCITLPEIKDLAVFILQEVLILTCHDVYKTPITTAIKPKT